MRPLVSVICLCYNQRQFVRQAVESVVKQTYPSIQLILIDDASTDGSAEELRILQSEYPQIELMLLDTNLGNCAAFNRGLTLANGEYVIDLAADDVLMLDRIERQVNFFFELDDSYGVVFTDAEYIDANNKHLRFHFEYLLKKGLLKKIPQGDVYRDVLSRYFIPSPTMLIRKKVMDELKGYDETLSYEDFDFWVRSSRKCKYAFLNIISTQIRRTGLTMSTNLYKAGNKQLHSTYLVTHKALALNRGNADKQALLIRVRYEMRQALLTGNFQETVLFFQLLEEMGSATLIDRLFTVAAKLKLPLQWLRSLCYYIRYDKF